MGGKSTSTQTTQYDPAYMARINSNYDRALSVADTPFQPYTGERVASFSPLQVQGQQGLLAAANDPTATNTLNQATSAVSNILGYQAPSIYSPGILNANTISAPTLAAPAAVTAGQLKDTDLTPYLNPYTEDVVNTTLGDLSKARAGQQVTDNQSATAAKAFGGTRQAVQNALSTDDYLRNVASTTANLRNTGYNSAVSAAQADLDRALNAGEFNTNLSYDASKTNAANQFAANQYNATAGTNANEYNLNNALDIAKTNAANDISGTGLRLNAASSLASLSDQQLTQALQRAGIIEGVGAEQTQQQQAQDDFAYQEFLRQLQQPYQNQSLLNSALGMFPTQATTTSTQSTNPGLGGILGGVASLGLGIGSLGTDSLLGSALMGAA